MTDPLDDRWRGNLPRGPHAHSVAADARTGRVFIPVAAGEGSPCPRGCIEVFRRNQGKRGAQGRQPSEAS